MSAAQIEDLRRPAEHGGDDPGRAREPSSYGRREPCVVAHEARTDVRQKPDRVASGVKPLLEDLFRRAVKGRKVHDPPTIGERGHGWGEFQVGRQGIYARFNASAGSIRIEGLLQDFAMRACQIVRYPGHHPTAIAQAGNG